MLRDSPYMEELAVPVPKRLFGLAATYPLMMAAGLALKPSISVNAAFWPSHAVAFVVLSLLPPRRWPAAIGAFLVCDLVVIHLGYLVVVRMTPGFAYLLMVALANLVVVAGMATAIKAHRHLRARHRHFTLSMPLWVLAAAVGALPGVLVTAYLHARHAHLPLGVTDIVSRWLGCILSVVAGSPLLFGLVRGFRAPAKATARRREGLLILATFIALGAGLLVAPWPLPDRFTELLFFALPMLWLALRGSRSAVDVAIAATTAFVAFASARGIGAFADHTALGGWTHEIMTTQIYLLLSCCEALFINRAMLERNALLAEREQRQAQLAAYAQALDRAGESARQAAAADLHDGVGQILAGQGLILCAMRRLARPGPGIQPLIDQAIAASQEAQTVVRRTIQDLCPPDLEGAPMANILAFLAALFDERYGFRVAWSVEGHAEPKRLQGQVLFRAIRELIYNAYKHSQTGGVRVDVAIEADAVHALIIDQGIGFDVAKQRADRDRFGLHYLVDRLRGAGGSLAIESAPGLGCRATVVVPLLPVAAGAAHATAESVKACPTPSPTPTPAI